MHEITRGGLVHQSVINLQASLAEIAFIISAPIFPSKKFFVLLFLSIARLIRLCSESCLPRRLGLDLVQVVAISEMGSESPLGGQTSKDSSAGRAANGIASRGGSWGTAFESG